MKNKNLGDIPDELLLPYPLQLTTAPTGGHSAEKKTPLEANQMARRKALIRIQEHLLLIFPGAGWQIAYIPRLKLNFWHLNMLEFTIAAVGAGGVTIYWASGVPGGAAQFVSPLHLNLALGAYRQVPWPVNPLTALQSGDYLYCNATAACTVSGEIVGWESPEEWAVDLPIR